MFKQNIDESVIQILIKTIIPATVAMIASIAYQMKNQKVTVLNAVLSMVVGVSVAWICGDVVHESFSKEWASVAIGLIAICGDKVAHWLIYEFNFSPIGNLIVNKFKSWLK